MSALRTDGVGPDPNRTTPQSRDLHRAGLLGRVNADCVSGEMLRQMRVPSPDASRWSRRGLAAAGTVGSAPLRMWACPAWRMVSPMTWNSAQRRV